MDLSKFATKENSDNGVWFPVKVDGQKLPLALKLVGADADVVIKFDRDRLRKIGISKDGKANLDEDTLDELLETQDDAILVRICGISSYDWKKQELSDEPVTWGDKTLGNDKKSYSILIENIPALKNFIKEKSDERSNFLSVGKKN